MTAEKPKPVGVVDLLKPTIDEALRIARESALTGPTGYGAACTTGDGKVMVLRAPSQAEECVAPVTILGEYGDAARAESIWRGHLHMLELERSRRER